MKKVCALFLAMIIILSLAACGASNSIVGKWELSSSDLSKMEEWNKTLQIENVQDYIENNGIIEFYEDGSCNVEIYELFPQNTLNQYKFSLYETKENGKVYFDNGRPFTRNLEYSVSGNQLTIILDETSVLPSLTFNRI